MHFNKYFAKITFFRMPDYCEVLDCYESENCPVHSCANCIAKQQKVLTMLSERREICDALDNLSDSIKIFDKKLTDLMVSHQCEINSLEHKLAKWMTVANSGNVKHIQQQTAIEILGSLDPLIAWSKSGYSRDHPDDLIVYNANVLAEETKIWYGDLNVTESAPKLQDLANVLRQKVLVLDEMDAKWDTELKPDMSHPVRLFMPE